MANLLQAVMSPSEVPIYDNFARIEHLQVGETFYIESRTSNARIVFKDGKTYTYDEGYYRDQLWYLQPYNSGSFILHNAKERSLKMFYNGSNVGCFNGKFYEDQLWMFKYVGNGYYRIINKKYNAKLFLQTGGTFGAFDGEDYDDQLWRLVPEKVPLVMFHSIAIGGRMVGKEKPTLYRGPTFGDQRWRLVPVEMEEGTCPRFFYIQNFGTGHKLVQQKSGSFFGYIGNNYPDQHWEVKALGGNFQFENRITKGKLSADSNMDVFSFVGGDKDNQQWMLLPPVLKRLNVRSVKTLTYLEKGGTDEWSLIPNLDGGYYFLNYKKGGQLYYKPSEFDSFNGPIYSDQVWNITSTSIESPEKFEITNTKFSGQMFSKDGGEISIALDPVTDKNSLLFQLLFIDKDETYDDDLMDEISDGNIFWLEDSDTIGPNMVSHHPGDIAKLVADVEGQVLASGNDQDHYGFQGLTDQTEYVYRVCPLEQDITNGINCSDPNSCRTVSQHVSSGSRIPSRFISTTADFTTARLWAFYAMNTTSRYRRNEPLRIIRIRIEGISGTELESGCVNLNNENIREHFIAGATARNFARSSREVLFQYRIRSEFYELVGNPEAPPHPPPMKRKRTELKLSELMANISIK